MWLSLPYTPILRDCEEKIPFLVVSMRCFSQHDPGIHFDLKQREAFVSKAILLSPLRLYLLGIGAGFVCQKLNRSLSVDNIDLLVMTEW